MDHGIWDFRIDTFKVLNQIHFPSISAVTPEEFKALQDSSS